MGSEDRPWFYLVDDAQIGPVAERVIRHMLRDDQLERETIVWTPGMSEWEPAWEALPRYVDVDFEELAPALADEDPAAPEFDLPAGETAYFPVSTLKFIVMSVVTGGLYQLYWSYRNWKFVKNHYKRKILPFWRAWFVLFFHYDQVRQIKTDLGARVLVDYRPGWLTIAYLVWLLVWRLPEPFSLVTYLDFVPLLPVVAAINAANRVSIPEERMNSRFSGWNLAVIAVFVILQVFRLVLTIWPGLSPI
jgi:hypothetical protein